MRPQRLPAAWVTGGIGWRTDAATLQALDALEQCADVGVQIASGEPDQRHFQIHPRVGGLAHVHQSGSQHLKSPGEPGRWDLIGGDSGLSLLGIGEVAQIGTHRAQKGVAQAIKQGFADDPGLPPRPQRLVDGDQGGAVVVASQGLDDGVDLF